MLEERADVPIVRPLTITNHAGQSAACARRRAAGGTGRAEPRESRGAAAGRHRAGSAQRPPPLPPALLPGTAVALGTLQSRLSPSSPSPPLWGSGRDPGVFSMEGGIGLEHLSWQSPHRRRTERGQSAWSRGTRAEVCGGGTVTLPRSAGSPDTPSLVRRQESLPVAPRGTQAAGTVTGVGPRAESRKERVEINPWGYFSRSYCPRGLRRFPSVGGEGHGSGPREVSLFSGSTTHRHPPPRALSPKYRSSQEPHGRNQAWPRSCPAAHPQLSQHHV